MASLDELTRAGFTVKTKKSSTDQILGMLQGVDEQSAKIQQKEKDDVMEQVKLYGLLREQGYTEADAHQRVTRAYRSTSFVERILGGKGNAFQPPAEGTDKASLERRKTEADIGKTESETKKNVASAGYYERGGPRGMNADSFTPNQLQTRIKALRETELGMGDRPDEEIQSEIDYLTELINKKSGFRKDTPEDPGKAGSVVMTGPDGKPYRIPKTNVARAKARGFKDQPVR